MWWKLATWFVILLKAVKRLWKWPLLMTKWSKDPMIQNWIRSDWNMYKRHLLMEERVHKLSLGNRNADDYVSPPSNKKSKTPSLPHLILFSHPFKYWAVTYIVFPETAPPRNLQPASSLLLPEVLRRPHHALHRRPRWERWAQLCGKRVPRDDHNLV